MSSKSQSQSARRYRHQRKPANQRASNGRKKLFTTKNGNAKAVVRMNDLPHHLQGPAQNRFGGTRCTTIDPGSLWKAPHKAAQGRIPSEEERKEVEERLKANGLL